MRFIILSICIVYSSILFGQGNIGGSWYGKAEANLEGNHNSYLTELIIRQKGNKVEGILGYYFRDGYRSLYIHGNYNQKTREFVIKNLPITYFRASSIDGVDCFMDLHGTLSVSKVSTAINAVLVANKQYKYTCPEFQVSYIRDDSEHNQDSVINKGVTRRLWQPQPEDMVVNAATPVIANAIKDTLKNTPSAIDALVSNFNKRGNVITKEIEVDADSLRISFYDNGTIDGDSISVFVNNKPVLTRQELTAQALNIYIKLDASIEVNEITMYAENLGQYPPNTALMIVNDGITMHEIYLSSSLDDNAAVRIRRKKK